MPFLDTLIQIEEGRKLKTTVYRKKTHTNQYLAFTSHHPLHQKLGVVRTLLDRCEGFVMQQDKEIDTENIKKALSGCGYPRWSMDLVEKKLDQGRNKEKYLAEKEQKNKGMVVLPYVKGLTEGVERIMRKKP